METKKFLDYEGIKTLYSNLSMNDYPNNETLIAALEAIDTTKQDKINGEAGDIVVIDENGSIATKTPVAISQGGTGATTKTGALNNLGLKTESWEFTLENGNVITKDVVVSI